MTIDEAIQNSKEAVVYLGIHHQDRLLRGVLLGIEALKRCKKRQEQFPNLPHLRLLGETKD